MSSVEIVEVDLDRSDHRDAVLTLVDEYAQDPMGNDQPLPNSVREALIPGLKAHPTTLIFLALETGNDDRGENGGKALGIAVCFRGFSTFRAMPLINLHDLFVRKSARGKDLGRALLQAVAEKARSIGACKVTLEVQSENLRARGIYAAAGFEQAVYKDEAGGVFFLTKPL
jgi:GNAT superfamily N-acetyltransferase